MTDPNQTDAAQPTNQPLADRVMNADWTRYGSLAVASTIGLIINSLALIMVTGNSVVGIADGVVYLAPVVVLAAVAHDVYSPLADTPYLGPATLFLTLALANAVSLSVKVFRAGAQSEPALTLMILGFLALLFTPGAWIATWATRRWFV